ncbi:MAG: hypothetical protein P1U74_01515 [Legionellaceae bacterium]|nr:hypothetical protein [Legionellaceae bacterium]
MNNYYINSHLQNPILLPLGPVVPWIISQYGFSLLLHLRLSQSLSASQFAVPENAGERVKANKASTTLILLIIIYYKWLSLGCV